MNIPAAAEFFHLLREKVESGEYPSAEAVWREAMRRFQQAEEERPVTGAEAMPADPIDHATIAYCAREIQGKDIPSLEEVRRILSKVSGSLSEAVAEEREDRS